MSNIDETILTQRLKDLTQSLSSLEVSLLQEKEILAQNDIKALEEHMPNKNDAIIDVSNHVKKLNGLFQEKGLDVSGTNILNEIKSLSALSEKSLSNLWQDILLKYSTCQKLNYVNGTVINVNTINHQRLMNLLLGADENTTVYDQKGKRKTLTSKDNVITT